MRFYLEDIIEKTDGTSVKSLTGYATQDEAETAFHREVSYPTQFDDTAFVRCSVINEHGGQIMIDTWKKDVPVDPETGEPVVEETTKYYLSQLKFKADGTTESYLFDFETQNDAFYTYHNGLSDDMESNLYIALMSKMEDKFGNEIKRRYWEKSFD